MAVPLLIFFYLYYLYLEVKDKSKRSADFNLEKNHETSLNVGGRGWKKINKTAGSDFICFPTGFLQNR